MTPAVWYATEEEVRWQLDSAESARNGRQIRRAIAAATDWLETEHLDRKFYPTTDTRFFDWPSHVDPVTGTRTVALGRDDLWSQTAVAVNGVLVDPSHVVEVRHPGGWVGALELDASVLLAGTAAGAVGVAGDYGAAGDVEAAGTATAVDAVATSLTVSDSQSIGVGSLLRVGSERMIVTARSMADTGQNLNGSMASRTDATTLEPSGDPADFDDAEVLLLDGERMLIVDRTDDYLVVKRAWDGSVLAAHQDSTIYALRRLTVQRGVLGTTAASHSDGAQVYRYLVPPFVNELCVAEAMVAVRQQAAGYGLSVGTGDANRDAPGAGLPDLRNRVWMAYGRKAL